uniref:G_PROTEIN_RECEP_F1_2 domain-containing protein n=2 Tax=Loa loa TaxID=7209 RepID=A0A1I7VDS7_LOALO
MNVTVNRTTIDDLKNVTIASSSVANHDAHLYAYLIIGPMLVLINTPIFLLVMIRKALRKPYLVLAVVFLNNGLTGISAVLMGIHRWIVSATEEQYVAHHNCVLNIATVNR